VMRVARQPRRTCRCSGSRRSPKTSPPWYSIIEATAMPRIPYERRVVAQLQPSTGSSARPSSWRSSHGHPGIAGTGDPDADVTKGAEASHRAHEVGTGRREVAHRRRARRIPSIVSASARRASTYRLRVEPRVALAPVQRHPGAEQRALMRSTARRVVLEPLDRVREASGRDGLKYGVVQDGPPSHPASPSSFTRSEVSTVWRK
jgi:hypothetical protein